MISGFLIICTIARSSLHPILRLQPSRPRRRSQGRDTSPIDELICNSSGVRSSSWELLSCFQVQTKIWRAWFSETADHSGPGTVSRDGGLSCSVSESSLSSESPQLCASLALLGMHRELSAR
ncbi:hypothetical protein C8Q78DRAFT_740632 [Trametes maxima]|nr:hypothetical protein C8Q78DRAFT_740632 [Trametes maxima]